MASRLRSGGAIPVGLYRSAVLVALTGPVALVAAGVGVPGLLFALSWSDGSSPPLAVRLLALGGEMLMALLWTSVAVWLTWVFAGRALSEAARRVLGRWRGAPIESSYLPVAPVTRMATGYWWNGHEYHGSEREARRRALLDGLRRDPQARRDAAWLLAAGITVLPVAALPLASIAFGVWLWPPPGLRPVGAGLVVAGLAGAPFAWRVAGPLATRLLTPPRGSQPPQRVEELEAIRADLTRTQLSELERIERGLHDGPQARLVALGMSMGAAERLIERDPAAARKVLADARAASAAALDELRSLVRGINPPVLTERGLVDAVRALALDAPIPVTVRSGLSGRPERPVEAAVYFAVAELLANTAKHADAAWVTVEFDHGGRVLTATVTDDGSGGAVSSPGSGLSGIERRLAAFDGSVRIDSPAGGPTRIEVTVPCALS
ncbi:histidine kinase [Phytomonospora sp. NPDC050363]|uniref:sensor histidine kinase n=1 Tax=Phytomonospora sp. NPDC050363 TaxID=3155642 RepID=UPI0033C50A2A